MANARVLGTLFRLATSGTDVAATIFWCKTRCGWRENDRRDPISENQTPIVPQLKLITETVLEPRAMTIEQLEQCIGELARRRSAHAPASETTGLQ
jgi:hypothetical protein